MHTCAVVRLRELLPRSKFCHRSPMSPIKWSSELRNCSDFLNSMISGPEKVRRDKSLLPNELFLDIFDRIVPGPQGFSEAECQIILRRLAFVCRFFFAECTRRVYTRITLVGNKNSLAKRQGHGEWFKQIKANNKLAKHFTRYVERCEMVQWQSRDSAEALGFPKMMSLLLNQRAQIIASFENLTALQLLNVPITSPLFVTIFSKETLQIVEIVGCVFTPPERSWNVSPFKARWSSLLIERCPGSHLYLAPLKKLAASSKLQSFKTDINVIACILSLPAVFNGLQELNIPSSANVVELLNRTPTITKLGVTGDCSLEISSLLKTSVPHLTALTCSINNPLLLELSGRPKLRTIRLEYAVSSPQTVKRAWEALKRAKSLQSVSTTSGAYCCFSLHESLHTVDELRLFCEPPPPGRGHILLSDWVSSRSFSSTQRFA